MPFRALAGHRRLTALLSRAIGRGTLPPTLLFTGPAGVGKWRTAVATAQTLNCLAPVQPPAPAVPASPAGPAPAALPIDACGECRACDRIARGVHVDVIAIEPDERASIKIDVIREVLSRTSYRPFEGKRRVVLIREAETLEVASQNALLKSLEEPPPATVFILCTAVPGALLGTVRSRAMALRFGRLTAAEVSDLLVRNHEFSEDDARALAALADGSVGQALDLSSTDVSVMRETALLLLQETADRADVPGRLQAAAAVVAGPSKKERSREDLAVILRLTASMLRDIEAINSGADPRVLANLVVADDLQRIARNFAGDRARSAFDVVDRALFALDRNAGAKVVTDWLSMHI
jgi:DNA polymerase-3 subunit delta'